ncbi:MAG: VWA domain-containing protein [Novosphingobium sp.]|nr:VWA domain-containing protein [Novosphingobium sp.]
MQPARDLLLALDISQSMEARDFPDAAGQPQERLTGARAAIAEFVARRPGDRLGLLVFANGAHLAVPFTLDHALLTESLAQLSTGMAGPRTMIGDAIGLGLKLYEASRAPAKVMILLTDGADTGSRIPPETAARLARSAVSPYTIALGQPGNAVDKVDTAALQAIASLTGGRFALAGRVTELHAIYRQLDALEADKHTRLTHRARHSLFHWPLAAALSVFVLGQLWAALLGRGACAGAGKRPPRRGGRLSMPDLELLHFLRPLWLLGIPLACAWSRSPHCVSMSAASGAARLPIICCRIWWSSRHAMGVRGHGSWLASLLSLGCLALAGPSWQREPAPFADDRGQLVIVLDLAASMNAIDVAPTRLARAPTQAGRTAGPAPERPHRADRLCRQRACGVTAHR